MIHNTAPPLFAYRTNFIISHIHGYPDIAASISTPCGGYWSYKPNSVRLRLFWLSVVCALCFMSHSSYFMLFSCPWMHTWCFFSAFITLLSFSCTPYILYHISITRVHMMKGTTYHCLMQYDIISQCLHACEYINI